MIGVLHLAKLRFELRGRNHGATGVRVGVGLGCGFAAANRRAAASMAAAGAGQLGPDCIALSKES